MKQKQYIFNNTKFDTLVTHYVLVGNCQQLIGIIKKTIETEISKSFKLMELHNTWQIEVYPFRRFVHRFRASSFLWDYFRSSKSADETCAKKKIFKQNIVNIVLLMVPCLEQYQMIRFPTDVKYVVRSKSIAIFI